MDDLNDDDSDNSVIHQDSDDDNDDFEHDDDIDIGFRRHQYETFDDDDANNRKRKLRRSGGKTRRKDEAIYGVFMDDDDNNENTSYPSRKRSRQGSNAYEPAPMFVAAKRKEGESSSTTKTTTSANSMFVAAQKQDDSMFVAASQKQEEPKQQQQQQQQKQENNMFVAAASTASSKVQEANNKGNDFDGSFGPSTINDEDNSKSDDDKEIEQKQKEADQYFLSLLNQARAKKKKRPPASSVPTPPPPPPHVASFHRQQQQQQQQQQQDPVALGMMPSSFGGGGGFYSSSVWPPPEKKINKDPNIAKWEKHTKGIGSKLLAKMGWSGKGGLGGGGGGGGGGSNKRRHQKKEEVNSSIGVADDGTSNDNNNNTSSNLFQPSQPQQQQQQQEPPTTTTLPSSSNKKPKTGISRPVEVVVRPNNMGLGFGNFKEATQLKVNRQIEAEVRGIEVDEPSKKKKKKKKPNYYGENDDDEDDIMDDDKNNELSYKVRTTSSAIPSTEDLLEQKQWKKLRTGNQRKKKMYPKAQIIPYEKLLEQNQIENGGGQSTIIDMRGPLYDTNRSEKGKDGQGDYGDNGENNKKVLLAEELLHNVSFLLNTYENKLHSSANFSKSTEQKVASLKSDLVDMRKRESDGSNRLSKIEKTIQMVKQIEGITKRAAATDNNNNNLGSHNSSITLVMDQVQAEIKELEESYTSEERQSLRFWEIIVPSLLSPITKLQIDRWDPLKDDISKSKEVMDSFFNLHLQNLDLDNSSNDNNNNNNDNGAVIILRSSMIENQLVPRIKQVLGSSRWNPVLDTDIALHLYEYLDRKIQSMFVTVGNKNNKNVDDGNNVFPAGDDEDSTDDNNQTHNRLSEIVKKEIILDTIHPKILTALSNWKPELRVSKPNDGGGDVDGKSSDVQIANRFDLWILPWMPYLDHYPALIPNLLSDSKRKLKTGISYLQKHNGSNVDIDFLRASVGLLKPWRRVFDQKDLQRIVSDSITPKLARCLAKSRIQTKNVSSQTWTAFDIVFEMHGLDLLSDIDFLSIIEGEALVNLVSTINEFLLEEGNATTASIPAISEVYRVWKMHTFLGNSRNDGTSCFTDRSLRLVQTDRQICCLFYTILRMLHFTSTSEQDKLEQISCPITNYRTVLARRMKERRNAIEDDMVRLENARSALETDARIRLRRRNNVTSATFREVVEEFTNERGILFQPKMGANSRMDGKQIFLCGAGGTAVYMDGDVIFAQTVGSDSSSSWRPVPLEQLETM